jgi:putative hydrolase of the HAD superfamily
MKGKLYKRRKAKKEVQFKEARDMIKNVVFDLGRVLINFEPEAYLRGLFPQHPSFEALRKAIFGSAEWVMLDRGVIDQAEAQIRLTNQHPDFKEEIKTVLADWFAMLTPISVNVELLPELKDKGYRLYVISNFHEEAFAHVMAQYEWFQLFHGIIVSYEHRVLKPEPQIYRELLERYNLVAEECLFIDDVAANIEGARRMGMEAILYKSPDQLRRDLTTAL